MLGIGQDSTEVQYLRQAFYFGLFMFVSVLVGQQIAQELPDDLMRKLEQSTAVAQGQMDYKSGLICF